MDVLFAPFEVSFVQRAVWGGLLVSCVCALAGTWVVVRGMAFLGDAMAHGMLPGVALASLLGGELLLGAACSAAAMAWAVTALQRNPRFAPDTGIGLVFVGMLAAGVIIVSRSQSFAVDVTGLLFGDVLAIRERDLLWLAVATAAAGVVAVLGHRAFVALAFDPRKAHTLGLRPRWAQAALLGLLTLAIVASFHVAGTLLVFGLLIAPPAAATYWATRIPVIMLLAALFGGFATVTGLLVSWYAGTAAGATIVAVAVGVFLASAALAWLRARVRLSGAGGQVLVLLLVTALPLAGCGSGTGESAPETAHGFVEGAQEADSPQTRLVVADAGGAVRVVDLIAGTTVEAGNAQGVTVVRGDDRFGYLGDAESIRIVDAGAWTVDHGDHMHHYRTAIRQVGTLGRGGLVAVHGDPVVTAVVTESGTVLLDRTALEAGRITERRMLERVLALPYAGHLAVVAQDSGRAEIRTREGDPVATLTPLCPAPRGSAITRRGLVVGCADGAIVVTAVEGRFDAAKVAFPQPVPDAERPVAFAHRPASTTLVAPAGEHGVWVLDVRARTWRLLEIGPVAAANTAGEGSVLLTVTRDGVLHSHDIGTGAQLAQAPLLTGPVRPDRPPMIEIDSARAYVNDAAARAVHEIDYRDRLRRARTFPLDIAPVRMVEAGR
ncbi:zinc ABC transporter permease AztB [Nocardia sp. CDC159]|uniref:Zinc ABC transporter permease AztB n=1 Tax=Nocardia pulmonis TaxID=2951408 RepID=A0A9X2E4J2_9NOCA|nr:MULTISPECIES: zinc ABC transporter permease AztB [Nocardia]MCM6773496.1 zinc ABC transporter permease AztB [Nocardia pulmonis]MCM6786383.1 zinc ABC transporter permease AztB [Nocardia sp. CDC159]